ncbi:MAG: hypothetical protein ABI828_02965 [Actinomycetota bacterium]
MSTSANLPPRTEGFGGFLHRAAIAALFIEASLWSCIRLFSLVYVMGGEADLEAIHQTSGWARLEFIGISVAVAAVLFLAGAGLRNGSRVPARVAQVLASVINVLVLVRAVAALVRFSGAQAGVAAAFAAYLAAAALVGLAIDARSAVLHRGT